jgi:hypothetical protein
VTPALASLHGVLGAAGRMAESSVIVIGYCSRERKRESSSRIWRPLDGTVTRGWKWMDLKFPQNGRWDLEAFSSKSGVSQISILDRQYDSGYADNQMHMRSL